MLDSLPTSQVLQLSSSIVPNSIDVSYEKTRELCSCVKRLNWKAVYVLLSSISCVYIGRKRRLVHNQFRLCQLLYSNKHYPHKYRCCDQVVDLEVFCTKHCSRCAKILLWDELTAKQEHWECIQLSFGISLHSGLGCTKLPDSPCSESKYYLISFAFLNHTSSFWNFCCRGHTRKFT